MKYICLFLAVTIFFTGCRRDRDVVVQPDTESTITVQDISDEVKSAETEGVTILSGSLPTDEPLETDFVFQIINDGSAIKITGYTGASSVIRIPRYLQNLPVTTIGDHVFVGGRRIGTGSAENWLFVHEENPLTSVIIPDNITSIGFSAFRGNKLTNVIIPDSITRLGQGAFADNQLADITISNSLTILEHSTFENNNLTSVIIPDSVTAIWYTVFFGNQLANVIIGNSVSIIGEGAFMRNLLTSVTIPDSVTVIEWAAFEENPLTSITIGANVSVEDYAFDNYFHDFYNDNGRRAGVYTWDGVIWSFNEN